MDQFKNNQEGKNTDKNSDKELNKNRSTRENFNQEEEEQGAEMNRNTEGMKERPTSTSTDQEKKDKNRQNWNPRETSQTGGNKGRQPEEGGRQNENEDRKQRGAA